MQLGFVIDHTRCIGCHACTVACKSENEVPVGSFRTWVKYTEEGAFPDVRRGFAVLRCNQCTSAPCVEICPVTALDKRPDGIVDVDPAVCIGCKSCMHGCPYDALYINEETGTAEKCHFCAHRTGRGLAPACAVVCPTEAIIPGDFDDPDSRVSILSREHDLDARKPEAGTGPNVYYREVNEAGIDPNLTNASHGYIWSNPPRGERMDAQVFDALEGQARARTVYDVPRKLLWGKKITGYLFAKSLAAGVFPAAWLAALLAGGAAALTPHVLAVSLIALVFLSMTGALLVADLKKPSRFYYILIRPNWSSWLARGTYLIVVYSGLLAIWALLGLLGGERGLGTVLGIGIPTVVFGMLTASYTGWLFAQAKGRVLWMKKWYAAHLAIQAFLAGSALLLALHPVLGFAPALLDMLGNVLFGSLAAQLLFTWFEGRLSPPGREAEYARTVRLVSHGPFAKLHWAVGVGLGTFLPMVILLAYPALLPVAGILALVGLWVEEDVFVRAGQTLPIS
ncbi:MAG: polysulfide reductase NrfD [bacterium]|nr:polysulfide reductase NrfD [bacterium]